MIRNPFDTGTRPRQGKDFLQEYLAHAPAALALLRAIECRVLAPMRFEPPVLDLGCGDGLFGQIFFEHKPEVGLDHTLWELRMAARREAYRALMCADIADLPFADRSFATVFANGVLEHVHGLASGLREIARVLRPGGRLVFTVPTMEDERQLFGAVLLRRLGLERWAERYAEGYNRVFGQVNIHTLEEWEELLAQGGLRLVYHRTYASPMVFHLHDLTMPLSLPNFLLKRFSGRWVAFPGVRRVIIAPLWAALLRRIYEEEAPEGCSLLLVAEPILE